MRDTLIAKAHCSTMRALGLIVGTMSPTMSPRPHNEAHCSVFGARTNNEPPSLLHSLVHSKSSLANALPWLPHAADGRRAQTACRRYAMAHQTVPPTPPDPTTPALLPSRNQRQI